MLELMSWIQANSAALGFLSSILLTLITIVYVYLTGRLVKESQAMRLAMFQPELAIYLSPLEGHPNFMLLRIENVGTGPAYKIALSSDRPFQMEDNQDLRDLGMFQKGVKYLAPRQRIEHFLVSVTGKLEQLSEQTLTISASYANAKGEIRKHEFVLDFGEMTNLAWIGTPPLHEIARAAKEIQSDFHKIATGFNKIQVLTESVAEYQHRMEAHALWHRLERLPPEQLERIKAAIGELSDEKREAIE